MRNSFRWGVGLLATVISGLAWAQAGAPPAVPPSAEPPNALSSSLGVSVYPSKGQPAAVQEKDEEQCFGWAKSKTGINPLSQAAPPAVPPPGIGPVHRQEERMAAQTNEAQAAVTKQQHAAFNQAFGACMDGRGYATK